MSIFSRFTPKKLRSPKAAKSLPHARDGLKKLLTARQLDRILLATPDRRDLFTAAAMELDVVEEVILVKVSELFGLRFIPRVPPFIGELPSGLTLESLYKAAVIPLSESGSVRLVVTVDPGAAEHVIAAFGPGVDVALSSWNSIAQALAQSAGAKRDADAARALSTPAKAEVIQQVLGLIIQEGRNHGASTILIEREPDRARYRFTASTGEEAFGDIHPSVVAALGNYLATGLSTGHVETLSQDKATIQRVRIELVTQGVFSLDLKEERRVIALPQVGAGAASPTNSSSVQVLLIEDNTGFARVVEKLFQRQGLSVMHYTDASAALGAITSGAIRPLAVVCDVHMPSMDGFQFIKSFRALPDMDETPVVMLTSDEETDTAVELLEAGADNFLGKSEDPRKLVALVKRVIDRVKQKAA